MATKIPIQLKPYKVRKPRKNGVVQTGYLTRQCIVNVSFDLAAFLGVDQYIFPENLGNPVENPVNITHYGSYATGTYHGKTIYIVTDGEGGENYKKTYQMQIPDNYPIQFLRDFLKDRQGETGNKLKYVKIRNGRRYIIPNGAAAPSPPAGA